MMKRMAAAVLAIVFMLCLGGAALADEKITVTGSATVQLAPDMVMIAIGVTSENEEVLSAQQEVNAVLNRVVEVLTGEMGIAAEDVATTQYYINENWEYNYEKGESEKIGYEATAMLSVCVRDIAQAGAVIDAAMQAGANQLNGVEFMSSDQTAARDQALTLAVQDGMRKAKTIAAAAGVNLPALPSSIEEAVSSGNRLMSNSITMYDSALGMEESGATQLQAGMLSLTANVMITYEIDN